MEISVWDWKISNGKMATQGCGRGEASSTKRVCQLGSMSARI